MKIKIDKAAKFGFKIFKAHEPDAIHIWAGWIYIEVFTAG